MQVEENPTPAPLAGAPSSTSSEPTVPARGISALRDIAETIALFLIVFTLSQVFLGNFMIEQVSAAPNFMPGERILVDKVIYKLSGLHRGDMIVGKWPSNPYDVFKRVIGLPGERVEIRDNRVLIDGRPIEEPYLTAPDARVGTGSFEHAWVLGADEYFVMGDNRMHSGDSRTHGPMKAEDIVGRAWLRYWPLSQFMLIAGVDYGN
ncbi:MAG: signal peptidase I [Anaerolineae bacterium]|nr:signal peptidase I [Thermoflexales bacterium]MDW8407220.1 signal peptidase I [Anaerolineae bacterium]